LLLAHLVTNRNPRGEEGRGVLSASPHPRSSRLRAGETVYEQHPAQIDPQSTVRASYQLEEEEETHSNESAIKACRSL
jgi:hypothetical protein